MSLSAQAREQFERDGYLLLRGFFEPPLMACLLDAAHRDPGMQEGAYELKDGHGRASRLALWYEPGDDVFGRLARSERIVEVMEALLGDEVYHYHSKIMMKEPRVGGAWEWHQDYGYWYFNRYLFPDMGSCMVALDEATVENGCLQVISGSHRMGRLEHGQYGEQFAADPDRVELALTQLEAVPCEMAPGDALFFHCNLLHRSEANNSDKPRWVFISCYNTRHNSPEPDSPEPHYAPLARTSDDAIHEACRERVAAERRFMKSDTEGVVS